MSALIAALLASSLAAGPPERELVIERQQWSRAVDGPDPIDLLEVRNDFGDIRARLATDHHLDASMVVQRLDPAGEKVGFTVERRGRAVALVVSYPPGRVRDAVAQPAKDSYDRVDLVVFVPAGVALHAHTLRGRVEVSGLKSDVEAATRDGPIYLRTAGTMQARTVSGEIQALPVAATLGTPGPPFVLQSVSGTINVTLEGQPYPELRVESAGPITTDLPVSRAAQGTRVRVTSPGAGSPRLLLVSSETGSVRVERDEP
jgi:hypothetical protein